MAMKFGKSQLAILFLLIIIGGLIVPLHQSHAWSIMGFVSPAAEALGAAYGWVTGTRISATEIFLSIPIAGLMGRAVHIPPEIYSTWTVVRDFVNLFFILVLIIMAFGTIFNIPHYTYKEMFVNFLIAAVMINFSFAIGVYVVNITNDLTNVALTTINSATEKNFWEYLIGNGLQIGKTTTTGTAGLYELGKCAVGTAATAGNGALFFCSRIISNALLQFFLVLITIFTSLVMAIYLIIRIPFIWLYLIVSPVAWMGLVLPGIKSLWGKWWSHFLGWTLSVPAYIGILMLLTIILRGHATKSSSFAFTFESLADVNAISDWLYFFISILFMIGGLYYASKVGGLFKGIGGSALTATHNAIKYGAKAIPLPFLKVPGTQNMASISDIEGTIKGVVHTVQEKGLPPKVPFSWLYTGKEGAEKGVKEGQQWAEQKLGYPTNAAGMKAENTELNDHLESVETELKLGTRTLEEIKEDLEKNRTKLVTPTGNLNIEALANFKAALKYGLVTDKDQFLD